MNTSTAIGAGRAIMRITVPEMRQRLYPIRGGMNEYVKSKSFGTDLKIIWNTWKKTRCTRSQANPSP